MRNIYFTEFWKGVVCGIGVFIALISILNTNPLQVEEKMQKEAIQHNAAHYEVNTNGVVSFKWNK